MMAPVRDLWGLARGPIHIDPADLVSAVEEQVRRNDLDYRSRVLIRDSLKALRRYWGEPRVEAWLAASPWGPDVRTICQGPWDDDRGFPSLMRRVMDVTKPGQINRFFQDLARKGVRKPLRLFVGGSAALILPGVLSRYTEDIDVVNELPPELRTQHGLLQELSETHKLELSHFQSHYLPQGWEDRVHSLPPYGDLQVHLVDPLDVFLSKLFSVRAKDRQDLLQLVATFDKEQVTRRLQETTKSMLAAPDLRKRADDNWYVLYGEPLPA